MHFAGFSREITVTVTVAVFFPNRSFTSSSGRLCCTARLFYFLFREQTEAALAKAAAARFLQDSVDDGFPIRVLYEHKLAIQAPDIPDLPLYHMPS